MIEPQRAHQSEVQLLPKTPQLPRAKRTGWNTPATPFPQLSSLQPVPPAGCRQLKGSWDPQGQPSVIQAEKRKIPDWI